MISARKSSKLRKQMRGTTSLTSQGLHARNTLESGTRIRVKFYYYHVSVPFERCEEIENIIAGRVSPRKRRAQLLDDFFDGYIDDKYFSINYGELRIIRKKKDLLSLNLHFRVITSHI